MTSFSNAPGGMGGRQSGWAPPGRPIRSFIQQSARLLLSILYKNIVMHFDKIVKQRNCEFWEQALRAIV